MEENSGNGANEPTIGGNKMKKKRRVLAAVLCCALALVTVAYATNATKTIQAAYMNIKLVVDGVPITPKDSNGSTVEPFIYNGTTYLPVRAIGEALDKQVTWDGKTKTVYIGEGPRQVMYLLDVCPPYEKSCFYTPTTVEMTGKTYRHAFALGGWALFNLDGKYSTLEFDFGHTDGSSMRDGIDYHFYLDGKLVKTITGDSESLVKHYTIDLNNALQMKIVSDTGSSDYGFANVTIR